MRADIPGLILQAVIIPAGISLSADARKGDALLKLREHNLTEHIKCLWR